jgi:hypothetical protein
MLYRIAQNGTEPPDAFSARIVNRLKMIPDRVGPLMESSVMNFEDVVPILLEDYPLNSYSCGAVSEVLLPETFARSFTRCNGF